MIISKIIIVAVVLYIIYDGVGEWYAQHMGWDKIRKMNDKQIRATFGTKLKLKDTINQSHKHNHRIKTIQKAKRNG